MSNVLSVIETKIKKYHLELFIQKKKKKAKRQVESEIKTSREKR